MASGNLDALSAITTVMNPNLNEQFQEGVLIEIADPNLLPAPTDPQLMEEVLFDPAEATATEAGQMTPLGDNDNNNKDMEAEPEGTYCDLDVSTQETKQQLQARNIKTGLKEAWQKELDESQYIACTVPGCEMRYSTMFSFERHYKWCTGDKGKGVEKCPYCDSQFLATLEGIEDHVVKEHPTCMPDYNARRVAKKILATGRELERKTALEREARALELGLTKKESKRQTCYNRKNQDKKKSVRFTKKNDVTEIEGRPVGRGRGKGVKKTPAVKKTAMLTISAPRIRLDGIGDEENIDDPSSSSSQSFGPLIAPRTPKVWKTDQMKPIIPVTRNWGIQRKTYSRNSPASADQGDKQGGTSQSEDEESQNEASIMAQFENSEELMEGEEILVQSETGELIQFIASENDVLGGESIPIETEGCITIGNEYQDSDDDNYQLVIVTGTTDAAKAVQMAQEAVHAQQQQQQQPDQPPPPPRKLTLLEEIAKDFEVDLDEEEEVAPEGEGQECQQQILVAVKTRDLDSGGDGGGSTVLQLLPVTDMPEHLSVEESAMMEVETSDGTLPGNEVQIELGSEEIATEQTVITPGGVGFALETTEVPITDSDATVIEQTELSQELSEMHLIAVSQAVAQTSSSVTTVSNLPVKVSVSNSISKPVIMSEMPETEVETEEFEDETSNIAIVISQELGDSEDIQNLISDEEHNRPAAYKNRKRRPRILLPDRVEDDDSVDKFQLKIPKNLSTTIGDDFIPRNIKLGGKEKLLFNLTKEDPASLIANMPETPSTSATISNGSFSNNGEKNFDTNMLFDRVANEDQIRYRKVSLRTRETGEMNSGGPQYPSQIVKRKPRRGRVHPVHQAIFGEKPVPEKFHMINPSKGAIPASIQSIIAASGGAQQIKVYATNKDGTLAPLEDLSLLSGSSQIKFMSHDKDGKLTPVQGDPETLLRTVKRMVNPGIKEPNMMIEEQLDEEDEYDEASVTTIQIPKKRGRGRPPKNQTPATPPLTRLHDGSVYIRKPSFLSEPGAVVPRVTRGRARPEFIEDYEPPKRKRGRPPKYTPPVLTRTRADDDNESSPPEPPRKRTRLSDSQLGVNDELNKIRNFVAQTSTPVSGAAAALLSDSCHDSSLDVSELNGTVDPNKTIDSVVELIEEEDIEEDEEVEEMEDEESSSSNQRRRLVVVRRKGRGGRRLVEEDLDEESSQTGTESPSNMDSVIYRRKSRVVETAFKCSACQTLFDTRTQVKNHIIAKHNGLAKVNDDTPLTPREVTSFMKIALKTKKYLTCHKEDCGRTFRSVSGYTMHEKTCGVEVQMVACQFCNRSIRETSYAVHIRQHKLTLERQQAAEKNAEAESPKAKPKITRKAAQMANTRLEQFVRAELGDDLDKPFELDDEPIEKAIDKDYDEEEDEDSRKDDDLAGEVGVNVVKVTGRSEKWIRSKMKVNWSGKFKDPDDFRVASNVELANYRRELSENKTISCRIEGCIKTFASVPGMVNHWQRCGLDFNYRCLVCNEFSLASVKKFYLHLLNHGSRSPSASKSSKAVGVSGYRDLMVAESEKFVTLEKLNLNPKMVTWTYEYYMRHHSDELYSAFRPARSDWIRIENTSDYLPLDQQSVSFKVRGTGEKSEGTWTKLKLFETHDPATAEQLTINIGGPIWACAWCPVPLSEGAKADQYAAISCSLDHEATHRLDRVTSDEGVVQIWNFGDLSRTTVNTSPKMSLAIPHKYGRIWDLKWCPSGCWEDLMSPPKDNRFLPRLGLLALACGDGHVRFLSIPHPEYLLEEGEEHNEVLPLFVTSPVCILPPPETGLIVNSFKTSCTSVAFERTDGHGKIATGYGNGLVALWDLQSDSPLILARRRQIDPEPFPQTLRPFHHFLAHSSCVTSLTFSPVPQGRFLFTGGMDKLLKLWDLDDTSVPVDQSKKCLVRKVEATCHSNGVYAAMDQGFNVNATHTFYKECGYYDYPTVATFYHNSTIWGLSVSEWLNSELSCNEAGNVQLITLPLFNRNLEYLKTIKNYRWPIYCTELEALPPVSSPTNANESLTSVDLPPPLSSCETFAKISSNYGLVFKDAPLSSLNQLSSPEVKKLTKPENMSNSCAHGQYPLASVNTVCWNPNLGCHLWFLTAGQSGLARLSCMSALRQPAAGRLIAKLQQTNNEKT